MYVINPLNPLECIRKPVDFEPWRRDPVRRKNRKWTRGNGPRGAAKAKARSLAARVCVAQQTLERDLIARGHRWRDFEKAMHFQRRNGRGGASAAKAAFSMVTGAQFAS